MKRPFHVVNRKPTQLSPKFTQWVSAYGVRALARSLSISRSTVKSWVTKTGNRHLPRIGIAMDIVALSSINSLPGAPLTLEDILGEIAVDRVEVRQ